MLRSVEIIIPYNFQNIMFNYLRKHKSLPSTFSINAAFEDIHLGGPLEHGADDIGLLPSTSSTKWSKITSFKGFYYS